MLNDSTNIDRDVFNSNASIIMVMSSFGSNKSKFINDLLSHLNKEGIPYYLLAPTRIAVRKLFNEVEEISEASVQTIHSFLYELNNENEKDEIIKFDIKSVKIEDNAVIIIDEFSMLNYSMKGSDNLKYGTGNIFDDLLNYINLQLSHRKLVMIGDKYQLSLDINIIDSLQQFVEKKELFVNKIELPQLTSTDNLLLSNINNLKDKLEQVDFLTLPINTDNETVITTSLEKAICDYMWLVRNSIFISYTNKQVQDINLQFRKNCGFPDKEIQKKELLILMKNAFIGGESYSQGEMFIVESVSVDTEKIVYPITNSNERVDICLEFCDVELTHKITGKYIRAKILSNKLWSDEAQPTREELVTLLKHFRSRYKHLVKGSDEYKKAIREDVYYNALFVRFGYALTCHKANGMHWDNVFIDLNRSNDDLKNKFGFMWLYTALTRAKKAVYLIGLPNKREFNNDKPFEYFVNNIREHLIEHGYKLIDHKEIGYELQLHIQKDTTVSSFKFYRNKKMFITKLMSMNNTIHTLDIEGILKQFINLSLVEV